MTILQERDKQIFSSGILRLVGYGLLLLALVNLLFLLIPTQLNDPLWEFQTMGAIVERIPVTFLGLVLIYYGERSDRIANGRYRLRLEATILKVLSWFSLSAAVVLILTIPLSISDSFQIYNQHNATADARFVTQKDSIEQLKAQLKAASSKEEIGAILKQQVQVNIPNLVNTEKLKTDIIANLQNNQNSTIAQAESFREQKKSLLFKKCLRWNLGALISSILFFTLWKRTDWTKPMVVRNDNLKSTTNNW